MTSISLPPQSQPTMALHDIHSPDNGYSRRNLSMSGPFPNPPFVFPAPDPDRSTNTPPPPILSGSPPRTVGAPSALPAFSFNPGSDHTPQQPPPPIPTPPVNRSSGHRRRPSEFIGGERLVSPETVETAQKSDENPLPSPSKLPAPGPGFSAGGPGKRRHAHRRSQAVSSVDLTAISNALDMKPTLGSAPCVPSDRKRDSPMYDEIKRPMSHSASTLPRHSPPTSPFLSSGDNSPVPAVPAIPDTFLRQEPPRSEPPAGTPIQPEPAAGNSSPPATDISPSPDRKPRIRPKTADAWLFDQSANAMMGDGMQTKRPLSATGHSRTHKSLSSGLLDAALKKRNHAGDDAHLTDSSKRSSSDDDSDSSDDDDESSASPKKRSKAKARKKKVRSWAGSILTRGKSKRHQSKKDSHPSRPPAITRTNSDLGSGLDVDFDDDNIVILRAPTNPDVPTSSQPNRQPTPPSQPAVETEGPEPSLENSWKPRSFYEQGLPSDTLSPVIDLDAALGPFNTPEMPTEQTTASGFSAATKRMYSGGRRGEFVGPEMRYHRRAESAPEMPPFDRNALLSGKRLTNHSSMENADVFYEEEEDAFLAATSEPSPEDERRPSQVGSVLDDSDDHGKDSDETVTRPPLEEDATNAHTAGLGIRKNELSGASPDRRNFPEQPQAEPLHNARNPFMNPPRTPVEAIKQEEWQHHRVPAPPSPDVSPRFAPVDKRPATSPIELGPGIPPFSLHNGSSHPTSAFSSPDFTGSPSDAPRSVRTPSTTDRNFFSPSYNMSADFPHASIEDVPSLTSSASTSTNPMQRFSASFFPRRGSSDRAASFSAAVHRRTSASHAAKRSSLASLSKLMVGGNHANERSKLSYEEKPPGDGPERAKKKGRGLSRLMHFWRTKDKDKSNGDTVHEERST